MEFELTNLPEKDTIAKDIVVALIKEVQAKTEEKYQAEIEYLQEQIRLLRNKVFGRSSEKSIFQVPTQLPLFELPGDASGSLQHLLRSPLMWMPTNAKNVAANPCRIICRAWRSSTISVMKTKSAVAANKRFASTKSSAKRSITFLPRFKCNDIFV